MPVQLVVSFSLSSGPVSPLLHSAPPPHTTHTHRHNCDPLPHLGKGTRHCSGKSHSRGRSPRLGALRKLVSAVAWTTFATVSQSFDRGRGGGARGWGAGGWCRRSEPPGTGTPRHAPPERRHSHLQRDRGEQILQLRPTVITLRNSMGFNSTGC